MGGNPDECPGPSWKCWTCGVPKALHHISQSYGWENQNVNKNGALLRGRMPSPYPYLRGITSFLLVRKEDGQENKSMANLHLLTVTSLHCFLAYMQVYRQRDKMGGRFDTSGYEEMTGVEEETSVHVGLITNMEIGDLTNFTSNLLSSPHGQYLSQCYIIN
ncbi:hypothetical protein PoB_003324700 [Plakobranchus ocellatus]|uniref:Uncharacterized protein n=1 Tax=Plakobranchus ocellatus TaxID=259542 RepID=A0AAV4AHK4_9GAST|nr:hypothetical protein PoB_003324700 [Plakobranchus ocellatus]